MFGVFLWMCHFLQAGAVSPVPLGPAPTPRILSQQREKEERRVEINDTDQALAGEVQTPQSHVAVEDWLSLAPEDCNTAEKPPCAGDVATIVVSW
jgi:hypothetical protein